MKRKKGGESGELTSSLNTNISCTWKINNLYILRGTILIKYFLNVVPVLSCAGLFIDFDMKSVLMLDQCFMKSFCKLFRCFFLRFIQISFASHGPPEANTCYLMYFIIELGTKFKFWLRHARFCAKKITVCFSKFVSLLGQSWDDLSGCNLGVCLKYILWKKSKNWDEEYRQFRECDEH